MDSGTKAQDAQKTDTTQNTQADVAQAADAAAAEIAQVANAAKPAEQAAATQEPVVQAAPEGAAQAAAEPVKEAVIEPTGPKVPDVMVVPDVSLVQEPEQPKPTENIVAETDMVQNLAESAAPLSTDVTIEGLLEECIKHKASDIHMQVGLPPILRIDGILRPITTYPILTEELVKELVFATLDEEQQKILIKDKEFDYSFAFGDLGRFRVNAFHEKGNMAAALRLIPNELKTLEDLGLPGVVSDMLDKPHGLILVTGPTGSGKSTTLAAMIDKINSDKPVHIITIEDPIEFTHHSKRAVVAQREVHYDTFSYAAALRSILREDPDVVLIGEMRDLETIQAAITVAETGHLVFATLHTNSAAQSVDRIIDVFPAHQQPQIRSQLASVLNGIISQRLVPAIGGGRMAVAEIMVANPAVRAIIREGKTPQLEMAIQTGVDQGMQTMDRELARLVKAGTIGYDDAHDFAVDAQEFERLAKG